MAGPQRKPLNKRKIVPVKAVRVANVDYKDTALLRKFISERGKIRARRQERARTRTAAVHHDHSLTRRKLI